MIAQYKLQFNKKYLRDLDKIPSPFKEKIREKVKNLSLNPRPIGCKRVYERGNPLIYRIRCGDYRVVYSIHDSIVLVIIIEAGHRKEIYRKT